MPYSNIKLISFDLDNTLYDNWPVIQLAEEKSQYFLQEEFKKQQLIYDHQMFISCRNELLASKKDLHDKAKFRYDDLSLLRQDVLLHCCKSLQYSEKIAKQACKIFLDYRSQINIQQPILSLLQRLKQNYTLASVTNGNCDARQLTIAGLFESNYSPSQGYRAKPHPEMINQLFGDFNVSASQVLHVGDSINSDGGAAQKAGCQFYHFSPFLEEKNLTEFCDKLLAELKS